MKVGGNQSANDYFQKKGGGILLTQTETKKKYAGNVARDYKEELVRRVKEDTDMFASFLPD